jgi:hypothetical protein
VLKLSANIWPTAGVQLASCEVRMTEKSSLELAGAHLFDEK